MATFGYCRVSTARQAAEGESLDVQRRQIEGYAHMHGLALEEIVIEEGVSGRSQSQSVLLPSLCSLG
jgi:DNA invertase Pin-like site-specific DNA recombinase